MVNVTDKTINDVNNDTVINTTASVDEKHVLQFILSTIEEQKLKKKGTARMILLSSTKKILVKM